MAITAMTYFYERLGRRYPFTFLAVEMQSALFVVAGTLALFTFYYDGSTAEYLTVLAIVLALTEAAIVATLIRVRPRLRPISDWIAGERDPQATQRAWSAAISVPLALIKRDLPGPAISSSLVACAVGVAVLDLSWYAFFVFVAGATVALGYAAMLHYLAVETGMRPVLVDINSNLAPPRSADYWAVPLRTRLMVSLPLINLITGLVVAALTSEGGGTANLSLDVLVVVGVATTISLELTVMLSKSILRPIRDLEQAVERLREGDFGVAVPVTTGDELGELAVSFNQMVAGLAERERIREAFGTYLDSEIAEYILSEGFTEAGEEVEVTVMFCDVRDFTELTAEATPKEVVATLNRLFEVIVPIIARHGGHVDKFEGDGLLAMFGAPEPFPDHADRAVGAACEIARAVNVRGAAGELRIGIGLNTGTVIAGAIGGAGRLNFSVIGGAVNVASRVEAKTRETGDDILITGETLAAMSREVETTRRGRAELRGVGDGVELHAVVYDPDAEPDRRPLRDAGRAVGRRLPRPPRIRL